MRRRDADAKASMKRYADLKAYVKPSTLAVGDPVLVKDTSLRPLTPYQPVPLTIVDKKGSMVTAQRGQQRLTRNSSFFKKAPRPPLPAEVELEADLIDDNDHEADPHIQQNTPANTPPSDSIAPQAHPHPPIRRSHRTTHLPQKLQDYIL